MKRPTSMPPDDITKVASPMASAITQMFTSRKASDTPTAMASRLVPMAVTTSTAKEARRGASASRGRSAASSMWMPTAASRPKAIQWSTVSTIWLAATPSPQPMSGVSISTMPNTAPVRSASP